MSHQPADRTRLTRVQMESGTWIEVLISDHALERWIERFRPGLNRSAAERELTQLVLQAELRTDRPPRIGLTSQRPAFYVCLGDLVMPADPDRARRQRLVIRTVLPPRCQHPRLQVARRRRRALKAAERQERRARRRERDRRQAQRARRRGRL